MKNFQYQKIFMNLIIAVISFSISGCSNDWLDVKPDKTTLVPETISDFQGLMDNYLSMNVTYPVSGMIASDNYSITDAVFGLQPPSFRTDAYKWAKTMRHDENSDWIQSYGKILIDNIILDGLPKAPVVTTLDQQEWNNVKGQALFHRAYVFFSLLQTFGLPYSETTAGNDPGIPLRVTSDIMAPTRRNTVKECYDFIIRDVTESLNLLPEKAKILTRPSKAAAHAFLSRVYLSKNDYENSLTHANASLAINSSLIDFSQLPAGGTFIGRYNVEVLYHCTFGASILSSALIDLNFYNSFSQDDLRRTRFFSYRASNNTVRFIGSYESKPSTIFYGLATDEVYLNKAECLARLGRTTESIDVLNALIKTRWNKNATYPEFDASNPEEALAHIIVERNKELFFRGHRWMDLRRLNRDPKFAITVTRKINSETFILEPNSFKYAFPIPDEIIDATGIEQNPGWIK